MTVTINGSGTITGVSTMGTTVVNQVLTTPTVTSTMGVGNATPAASGAGITFPATQSASSDANTLDDYEEGSFTPVWAASSGSMTMVGQVGRYTKIGRLVTIYLHIITSANNAFSGGVYLTGLPFQSSSALYCVGPVHAENLNIAASAWVWGYVPPSSQYVYFRYWSNNSSAGTVQGSQMNAGSDVMFSASYFV
jgi:hypothetical protein